MGINKMDDEKFSEIDLNIKQKEAFKNLISSRSVLLTGPAGAGKCLGRDTEIIMYDGSVKKVQNITGGELVMGDDSTPRKVLSTSAGKELLYKISTQKGDSYIVNRGHILTFQVGKTVRYRKDRQKYTLKWGDSSGLVKYKFFDTEEKAREEMEKIPNTVDLPLLDCIERNKKREWRDHFQGVYTGLDFDEREVEFDPYLLGIWLGRGSSAEPQITGVDKEIAEYLAENLSKAGLSPGQSNYNKTSYRIKRIDRKQRHFFIRFLKKYNIYKNKHVPEHYKINSRENRLKLLAGLLDGCGYLDKNCFEITQKRKILADDICFLAGSLGFQVSNTSCEKSRVYKGEKKVGIYHRIFISGDTNQIPTLIKRKQAPAREQTENHLLSRIEIKEVGEGDFFGFELDGNGRFVLGNFIITHNSAVIKLFYKMFQDSKQKIALTSTTGVSAILIGGVTLHSYLGIGLGTNSAEKLVQKINSTIFYKARWLKLKTLIIDEVSMMSPELFDKLEYIARIIRKIDEPFGGIQLILSADFLQLPCVKNDRLVFEAESWASCIQRTCYLEEIIRQDDPAFQKCLNEVREAKLSEESIDILSNCEKNLLTNELGIRPTRIHPINSAVDKVNTKELSKLGGEFREYEMDIKVHKIKYLDQIAKYKKSIKAVEKLTLAENTQVMLLANLDVEDGLANGSRGVVVDFVEDVPRVRFMNGRERFIDYHAWDIEEIDVKVATIYQIPLKLAYACTVHSSQGLSLDCVEINMANFFEYGQAYVALSRVRSLKGLRIKNFDEKLIKAHPSALKFYKDLKEEMAGDRDESILDGLAV